MAKGALRQAFAAPDTFISVEQLEDFAVQCRQTAPAFHAVLERSLQAIAGALHCYSDTEICFSFNGGKDSTVVLHLLRMAYSRAGRKFENLKCVYFESRGNFPEVEDFMRQTEKTYGIELLRLPPLAEGLRCLVDDHGYRAVFLGTRFGDPDGKYLELFTPTSPGWPAMMRVAPVLRWTFGQVWEMVLGAGFPCCPLYEIGYTSLGAVSNSIPNPALLRAAQPAETAAAPRSGSAGAAAPVAAPGGAHLQPGPARVIADAGGYLPAWDLVDGSLERAGRLKSKPRAEQ